MKKNWKLLGMLLFAVVLLFTMCKPKTDGSEEDSTDSTNVDNRESVNSNIIDSLEILFPDVTDFYLGEKVLSPGDTLFTYRIKYSNADHANYRLFVIVNDGAPIKLLNASGTKGISFSMPTPYDGITPLNAKFKFYCLNAANDTVGGASETRIDTVPTPLATVLSTSYFTKVVQGGIVFWIRKYEANQNKDLKFILLIAEGDPSTVVTWPPTYRVQN